MKPALVNVVRLVKTPVQESALIRVRRIVKRVVALHAGLTVLVVVTVAVILVALFHVTQDVQIVSDMVPMQQHFKE